MFYPESLILATNPKPLIFYHDTTLLNLQTDLHPISFGPKLHMRTNCSAPQRQMFETLLDSLHKVQRVGRRLLSLDGVTNLLECDTYVSRLYEYTTAMTPTMICPRGYRSSLADCKTWVLDTCSHISNSERTWLSHSPKRTRRSAWWCHMGLAGIPRLLYESSGHSCEPSHISNIKKTLNSMTDAMGTLHQMVNTVHGKTVLLVRAVDRLNGKTNGLSQSLKTLDNNLRRWRTDLNLFMKQAECSEKTSWEFNIKYSARINRILASILRTIEIEQTIQQTQDLSKRPLTGYSDLPHYMAAELDQQLSKIPLLSTTAHALTLGHNILLNPVVDFEFVDTNYIQLNLLLTIPHLMEENDICFVEDVSSLQYQIKDTCYSGPIDTSNLVLVTCPHIKYFLNYKTLDKCSFDGTTYVCPSSISSHKNNTAWIGLPWNPDLRTILARRHKPAPECSIPQPLVHIGSRHYLGLQHAEIPTYGPTSKPLSISPLAIYTFPCEHSPLRMPTGLGTCPTTLHITLPIFTPEFLSYEKWTPQLDNSTWKLHYESLNIPPQTTFDKSTMESIDDTYKLLDNGLTRQLHSIRQQIDHITEDEITTLIQVLTYMAFTMGLLNSIVLVICCCFSYRRGLFPNIIPVALKRRMFHLPADNQHPDTSTRCRRTLPNLPQSGPDHQDCVFAPDLQPSSPQLSQDLAPDPSPYAQVQTQVSVPVFSPTSSPTCSICTTTN